MFGRGMMMRYLLLQRRLHAGVVWGLGGSFGDSFSGVSCDNVA